MCLTFGCLEPILESYADADMACDMDDRKSTFSVLVYFCRGVVSYQSKLQKCVALFIMEAKYITAAETRKEIIWMQLFLYDLGLKKERITVHSDSLSMIDLNKNNTYYL